ncbi:UDP-3-O-acylglucosamine N-acyltransferase [Limihaloglobus sulfuriphilus]|uniref:UDP-3-O-acylglucosamine N-acyltransferase n=1 Tax=Limihaloglobus sulfuriphilus TaxID=1851148 RepID=A0A1Q2MC44_9BACT|nr:UDP-3-O-(3-hydroxymyristoyl)glucosamine N-acyltransferase [Limihaloglobus sulfuriphilus]AQQ69812.1 UDP-3-O-acylglucosamine N-acyltransferase [Limihaloglobus sulfuriphilus]
MTETTLKEIAAHINGRIIGDENIVINTVSPLDTAGQGSISFLANIKYNKYMKTTEASAVLANKELETSAEAIVLCDDPYYSFCRIVELMYGHRQHHKPGISPNASIADTSQIGDDCCVYDYAVIAENVKIGSGCMIYPGVYIGEGTVMGDNCIAYPNSVIFEDCVIGNKVIIQANATIGQDGFGFATHEGVHHKIPHIKRVILEDDVEIGSNAAIERGSLRDTVIGAGAKIGDSVTIGHGARIGRGCLLVPQVGVAGTAELGQYCVIGGQAAIVGHIKVGDMVMAAGQAAITNDVEAGKQVAGSPAIDAGKARRAYTLIQTLPEMKLEIKRLSKELEELKKAHGSNE